MDELVFFRLVAPGVIAYLAYLELKPSEGFPLQERARHDAKRFS
jgi:hypothetical protein